MKAIWFIPFLLLFMLAGCNDGEDESQLSEISFTVNQELLDSAVTLGSNAVTFQPPKNWQGADASFHDRMLSALQALNEESRVFRFDVHFAAVSPDSAGVLIVTEAVGPEGKTESSFNEFDELLQPSVNPPIVKRAEFLKKGNRVVQYIISREGMVVFKLLLQGAGGEIFQFDYMINQDSLEEYLRTVEASLGSITTNQ